MNLKSISLISSLIGLFLLLFLPFFYTPLQVSSYSDLITGKYVKSSSKIISIKEFQDFKIINLENNITFTCDSCKLIPNQTVEIVGLVTQYKGARQITAQKMKIK
jgi:hypothetical protein